MVLHAGSSAPAGHPTCRSPCRTWGRTAARRSPAQRSCRPRTTCPQAWSREPPGAPVPSNMKVEMMARHGAKQVVSPLWARVHHLVCAAGPCIEGARHSSAAALCSSVRDACCYRGVLRRICVDSSNLSTNQHLSPRTGPQTNASAQQQPPRPTHTASGDASTLDTAIQSHGHVEAKQ